MTEAMESPRIGRTTLVWLLGITLWLGRVALWMPALLGTVFLAYSIVGLMLGRIDLGCVAGSICAVLVWLLFRLFREPMGDRK